MKMLERFQNDAVAISGKINDYKMQKVQLERELYEKIQLRYDLQIQIALEPEKEAEFEKEIKSLNKPMSTIQEKIEDLELKIKALEEVRGRKLEPSRDEAKVELDKFVQKRSKEIQDTFNEIRLMRGAILEKLLHVHNLKKETNDQYREFVLLSKLVDSKFGEDSKPVVLPSLAGLNSNSSGDHEPILPLMHECQNTYDNGILPAWYEEYLISGDVVSSAEVNNRRAKREAKEAK